MLDMYIHTGQFFFFFFKKKKLNNPVSIIEYILI